MIESHSSCIRISDTHTCPFCYSQKIIKNGHSKTQKQQYFCKNCHKRFLDFYTYQACKPQTDNLIIKLTKEGMGIRSIARILSISCTTLLSRYFRIANSIRIPPLSYGSVYEVDELRFYIRKKTNPMWLVCAYDRLKQRIVSFYIGKRTNTTINAVIKTLLYSIAKKIYTDNFQNYKFLIPPQIHSTKRHSTNHIERQNLNIRTHLKRFCRKTICYSKSTAVVSAILKIYFWAQYNNPFTCAKQAYPTPKSV